MALTIQEEEEIQAKIDSEVAELKDGMTPLDLLKNKMMNEYAVKAMFRMEIATPDKFMVIYDKMLNFIIGKIKTADPVTGLDDDGTVKVDYGDTK